MQFEIREADFGDPVHATGIVDLLNSFAADPAGGAKPLSADVRERLIPVLQSHPSALVLLAFVELEPIGIAVCFFGFSTFQARPLLNIHDLAVIPAFREKGVGRALFFEAENRAIRRGCCKLTLEVREDNVRALSLYERLGFADSVGGDSAPTRFLSKDLRVAKTLNSV